MSENSPDEPEEFPVIGEIWMSFQAILQINAKRLCEDIAKQQGKPPKELWNKVKQVIQVPIIDEVRIPEFPALCPYATSSSLFGTAVQERCRRPCVIGFGFCANHVGKPCSSVSQSQSPLTRGPGSCSQSPLTQVKRILDMDGNSFFQREDGIVIDKIGRIRGTVSEDGVLMLFSKRK